MTKIMILNINESEQIEIDNLIDVVNLTFFDKDEDKEVHLIIKKELLQNIINRISAYK